MADKFSLNGISNIFNESIARNEPTLAFELRNGKGLFLFMMFFDYEDDSTKDVIYIFMKNIQRMLTLKLYGNHFKGQFDIYIDEWMKELFMRELLLEDSQSSKKFSFENFFNALNLSIPSKIKLSDKVNVLRKSWSEVSSHIPSDVIEEGEKTILIGDVQLPQNKKPREKTLRKLYLYADGNADEIELLISRLKSMNRTVAWTSNKNRSRKNVQTIISTF